MLDSEPLSHAPTLGQRIWRRLCRGLTWVFYRRCEVVGLENLPRQGPVILCANHVNALADAVVAQASVPRPIHPVARSGLFRNPVLRPILAMIQAVPIYRRRTDGSAGGDNAASFERCFAYLAARRVLLIFPEGQSHSDPSLRPLKTGAARLALGHEERTGEAPAVVPLGLTFTNKGRFRADVLVQIAPPIAIEPPEAELPEAQPPETEPPKSSARPAPCAALASVDESMEAIADADADPAEARVRRLTDQILEQLRSVTINVETWEDLALMRLLDHFFDLRAADRSGDATRSAKGGSLAGAFRTYQRLYATHRTLRQSWPERVAALRQQLESFRELADRYGVRDYQLELRYRPWVVVRFTLRSLLFLVGILPPALWGLVNSALPYAATRVASARAARGRDQYDTAGMLFGLVFFGVFWSLQTAAVAWWWGLWPTAALYAASLPATGALALAVAGERKRIWEETRVFFLFVRRRGLRELLRDKREALEVELAAMARLARRAADDPEAALAYVDEGVGVSGAAVDGVAQGAQTSPDG